MSNTGHLINNKWVEGLGDKFSSVDPAKNTILWSCQTASPEQVNDAVIAARTAFNKWALTSIEYRIGIVKKFSALLTSNKERLSLLISRETGKPLWETATEVAAMIGKASISEKAYFDRTGITENPMPVGKAYIRHKPHGVVAVFGPYNFPGHLPNGHIVPALIAGNTIVFKPSELTPKVAEETIKLWLQAGLPEGVLNLVQGEAATGIALAKHDQIDGLFFTGSSRTGKIIHEQFAGHPGKILALEMGGNNPLIVKDATDTRAVVHDIIQSSFISSGQRCTCARKLYLQKNKQGDEILRRLIEATKLIVVDNYDAKAQPFMGSMISKAAAESMVVAQEKLVDLGATSLLQLKHIDKSTGFVTPGIIDVTEIENQMPDEEHFGPLLKVIRYDNFKEAIDSANNTKFGLSAGLLADSRSDYDLFYSHIRAGIVNWNRPITGASSAAPFGGIGESGNHRASAYYAADYCSFPVASVESEELLTPDKLSPGLTI